MLLLNSYIGLKREILCIAVLLESLEKLERSLIGNFSFQNRLDKCRQTPDGTPDINIVTYRVRSFVAWCYTLMYIQV